MRTNESKFGEQVSVYFPDSVTRAERLIGLCAIIEAKNHLLSTKIKEITDRKGMLTVVWFERPSSTEMATILDAWLILNESQIKHYLLSTANLICHG